MRTRRLLTLGGSIAVGLLVAGSALAQLTKDEQKCLDGYNNKLRLVGQQAGKDYRKCVKDAGKGKVMNAENCVDTDAPGKIAGKEAKVNDLYASGKCSGSEPIQQGAAAGNAAMVGSSQDLVHDVFGDPIAGVVSPGKSEAKCQDKAYQRSEQAFTEILKAQRKCKKNGMKGGSITDAVTLAAHCGTFAQIDGATGGDGKATAKLAKISTDVIAACAGLALPALFAGESPSCTASTTALGLCLQQDTRCRACEALNAADVTDLDCDLFDDGLGNASCPPRLARATCAFTLPAGQAPENVACWTLRVPENRMQPDGRTVELAIAVFKSTAAEPAPDPLVLLNGGPGFHTVGERVPLWAQATRDVVYFDQRGVGRSRPSLDCPEYTQAFADSLTRAQPVEQDAADLRAAMRACHDRLVGEGITLSAYTSAASALDLRDVMTALGYREWNVWGASYGTRVALTAMRDTPQGIRSVLLDSTVPVQSPHIADIPKNLQRSLDTLFTNCAADPSCDARYPELEQTLFELVARLNDEPVTLHPLNPETGQTFTVVITGDRLVEGIERVLYSKELTQLLPALIKSTAEGEYSLLTLAALSIAVPESIQRGVFYSVLCAEQAPFMTPEVVAAGAEGARPELQHVGGTYFVELLIEVCDFWGAEPSPVLEQQPVSSAIPTLILAGEYDPITPPDYGRLAAQTLSASSFFEFRGYAHVVVSPGCAADLVTAFLADPTQAPDAGCVAALPPLGFL